jgi:hypothetical protein
MRTMQCLRIEKVAGKRQRLYQHAYQQVAMMKIFSGISQKNMWLERSSFAVKPDLLDNV